MFGSVTLSDVYCHDAQVSILRDHVNLMYYFRSPASPQASAPGHSFIEFNTYA